MSPIWLKRTPFQLFKSASYIFTKMLAENLEHFKHLHSPATNCFFQTMVDAGRLYSHAPLYLLITLVPHFLYPIERPKQSVPRLVIYHKKAEYFSFSDMFHFFS